MAGETLVGVVAGMMTKGPSQVLDGAAMAIETGVAGKFGLLIGGSDLEGDDLAGGSHVIAQRDQAVVVTFVANHVGTGRQVGRDRLQLVLEAARIRHDPGVGTNNTWVGSVHEEGVGLLRRAAPRRVRGRMGGQNRQGVAAWAVDKQIGNIQAGHGEFRVIRHMYTLRRPPP